MLELNGSMLAPKFEWNPRDGEVRLTTLLHTDSNFDRRAFRSLLRSIVRTASRHHDELERLIGDESVSPPSASQVR